MQHIGMRLEDESGGVIENFPINFADVIKILWDNNSLKSFPWLASIDPYGLTIFNLNQSPKVIEELERLLNEVGDRDIEGLIKDSINVLKKVEQHVYIKFIGD